VTKSATLYINVEYGLLDANLKLLGYVKTLDGGTRKMCIVLVFLDTYTYGVKYKALDCDHYLVFASTPCASWIWGPKSQQIYVEQVSLPMC